MANAGSSTAYLLSLVQDLVEDKVTEALTRARKRNKVKPQLGSYTLAVCKDGKIIGYTRWQTTADVLETHGIYRTHQEAAVRSESRDNGTRRATDVIVTICEYNVGPDGTHFPDLKDGWRVWANAELTAFTDTGAWDNHKDYSGPTYSYAYSDDFGYTDVVEPDKYGKKYYEPVPVEEEPL